MNSERFTSGKKSRVTFLARVFLLAMVPWVLYLCWPTTLRAVLPENYDNDTTSPSTVSIASTANTSHSPESECAAAGGQWRTVGRARRSSCVIPFTDAGKPCRSERDCTGHCFLDSKDVSVGAVGLVGNCQRDIAQQFGCHRRIENGVAQGVLCVD